jgi:hypothetical protein
MTCYFCCCQLVSYLNDHHRPRVCGGVGDGMDVLRGPLVGGDGHEGEEQEGGGGDKSRDERAMHFEAEEQEN